MIELRLFALAGILVVTVVAVVAVLAVDGLIRWVARRRTKLAAPPALPNSLSSRRGSDADRIVRTRQAEWRLRC